MTDGSYKKESASGSRGSGNPQGQSHEQSGSRAEMTEAIFAMFKELVSMAGERTATGPLSKEASAALDRFTKMREAMDMVAAKAELEKLRHSSGG